MRDYDKEPLVIKDRWGDIGFWHLAILCIIVLCMPLYMPKTGTEISPQAVTLLYGTGAPIIVIWLFADKFLRSNIIITLTNNKIVRSKNGKILAEIEWKNIKGIKKTFIDFCTKKQVALSDFSQVGYFLLTPFTILIKHPFLLITKSIYKRIKSFSNTKIFDTVVFFDNNGEMVSLFMANGQEVQEVGEYLRSKNIDDKNLPVFYTTQYFPL